MRASTHVGFAGLLYLLFLTTAGAGLNALNAIALAAASLVPDVDNGSSYAGRLIPPLTRFIERRFGHRTLTHSLLFAGALFLVLLLPLLSGSDLAECVLAGYLSHTFLDTCTKGGVRLFYPFSTVRCVFPFDANFPHRFRVETNSKLDRALGVLFFVACLPALYVADQGYERFIRVMQHTVDSAVRDYEVYARSSIVFAQMDGHDRLSGEHMKGRFRVVGALNPHALVFVGPDGHLHTVGRDFGSDFIAEDIICVKGEPARSTVRTLEMGSGTIGALAAAEDSSVESYFFGEVMTTEDLVIPARIRCFSPVTGSGRRIRLNFARPSDLRELDLESVLATGGTVMVKTVRRESPGQTSGDSLPPPSGRARIEYTVAAGENVEFRTREGDTVREGNVLAVRRIPAYDDEQKVLNERKREAVSAADSLSLLELDSAVADAALAACADSLGFSAARELVIRGYASRASLARSELKWEKSKRALAKLLASRKLVAGKIALERARLALSDAEVRTKTRLHALRSELRSPLFGVISGIRREPSGTKERIVFIIRRLPP